MRFQISDFRFQIGDGDGQMDQSEMRKRTKTFALQVIHFTESLPRKRATDVIGRQLLRSATSVGANYRAACRAKSKPDFIAKMAIVLEEADETLYWMELLQEAQVVDAEPLKILAHEANELVSIIAASIITAKGPRS